MLHMVDLLIGLVTLAHEDDDVVLLCMLERPVDGRRAVDDDLHRGLAVLR